MKIFADTSFLIPAMIETHPNHPRAFAWIETIGRADRVFGVSSHSIAEVYAVLTALPTSPRISPGTALQFISENLIAKFEIIELTLSDYQRAIQTAVEKGMSGGVIFDILIAMSFDKFQGDRFLTFNHKDFARIFSDRPDVLLIP